MAARIGRERDVLLRRGDKEEVQVWDLATGRKTQRYEIGHRHLLLWPARGNLTTARRDKVRVIVFRDLGTGKEQRGEMDGVRLREGGSLPTQRSPVFSPQANLLALWHDGVIHVWNVGTGKKQCTFTLTGRYSFGHKIAISPDGRRTGLSLKGWSHSSHRVQLCDLTTGKFTHMITNIESTFAIDFGFSPDSKKLVTFAPTEVRFHDVSSGRECARSRHPTANLYWKFAFSRDGKALATAGERTPTIQLWDVGTTTLRPALGGHVNAPVKVIFLPDGRHVVSIVGHPKQARLWDLRTGKPLPLVPDDSVVDCAYSADGRTAFYLKEVWNDKTVFYADEMEQMLRFADVPTGRVLHTEKLRGPSALRERPFFVDLRLSADGKTLVARGYDGSTNHGSAYLFVGWDVATRKQIFRRHLTDASDLGTLSTDLKLLAFAPRDKDGGDSGLIRVENLMTGEHVVTLRSGEWRTRMLTFSPDGRMLATDTHFSGLFGGQRWEGPDPRGSALRLCELETGSEVLALDSEDTRTPAVAFSPNRRLLAFAGKEQTIIVWDLWRGKEWQRISGFDAELTCLAFSHDGTHLISGLANSTLLVWEVARERDTDKPVLFDPARAWENLGGGARKAFAAHGELALSPERALPFLKERLKPVPAPDQRLLRRLIAELDDDAYSTREKAYKELEELGERAGAALREALKKKPSLEAHKRMEALLQKLGQRAQDAQTLRVMRAIAVLEDIGTPAARRILETLAKGLREARQTREAKAALERLARRTGSNSAR